MKSVAHYLDRLRQARFLTISFLIHIALIGFLGGVVLFKAVQPIETFIASDSGFIEVAEEEALDTESDSSQSEFENSETTEAIAPQAQMSASAITTALTSAPVAISAVPTQIQTSGAQFNSNLEQIPSIRSSQPGGGGGKSLGALSSRGVGERAKLMQANGGKKEGEEAVLRGLRWLQKVQNPDGTWGQRFKPAMTGFALLCFLGHGETPRESVEFGGTVAKGIDAVIAQGVKANGLLGPKGYEHSIVTYALAEALAMTQDERIPPLLTQAVDIIIKGQRPDGGWAYGYSLTPDTPDKTNSDTSVCGWAIQALKTAKLVELHHENLGPALQNALKNIERVHNPQTGAFGYNRPGDRGVGGLTAVGVLSILFIEGKPNKMSRQGIDALMDLPRLNYKEKSASFYAWYYMTKACFQNQGTAWSRWNRMFQNELIQNQSADGSWPPSGADEPGKMNEIGPDPDVYRTALSILMLEVYYRYSPVSKLAPQG